MLVFFALLLLGGIQYPLFATIFRLFYAMTRFFYFKGYTSGVPENHLKIGGYNFPGLSGLIICSALFGINLLLRESL
ncbi:hypothetical protein KSP39_PZI022062 [Platanthera zijinensis]|uniref:Uncharacterized protein n=1 Tax=Platanthera zijinensis TaxID=2320716 RepID=A0AAP0AXM2_9ASPA